MKKSAILFLVAVMVFPSLVLASDGKVSVKPLDVSVLTGNEIKVEMRVSNLKNIYAFSFEIVYDNRTLQYIDYEDGQMVKTEPKPVFLPSKPKNGRMFVALSYTDSKTIFKESGTLMTLRFKALLSGKTKFSLEKLQARKSNFDILTLEGENAEITVISPPTKPIMNVEPEELDFGTIRLGDSKILKVHVTNKGKDGLSGTAESANSWLDPDPARFSQDELDISITCKPTDQQVVNSKHSGRISLFTNGGSKDIICRFYLQDKNDVDNFPPDLTIDDPKEGTLVNTGTVKLKGRTNPGVTLYVNGSPQPIADNGMFEVEVGLHEGDNKITLKARKDNGLETVKEVTVILDTIKPILQIKDPGETIHTQKLTVDGVTESGVIIKVGGSTVTVDSQGKFKATFDLNKGFNDLLIVATDKAGNQASWLKKVNFVAQRIVKITMWIDNPKAYVNGSVTYLKSPPKIKNSITFVPSRFVSEALEATVKWDAKTKSVETIGKQHTSIVFISSDVALLDGKPVKLQASPYIEKGGSTMVPLRFIAQDTLGAKISWDSKERRIDLEIIFNIQ